MRGINKAIIVGSLGQDPDVKYTPLGTTVATLSVATSETWNDKQTGEKQEKTEWHRVIFFDRMADICREYLKKGSKVYVEGKIQTRKWTDQQGVDRYTTEIVGKDMQMLDSRADSAGMVGVNRTSANPAGGQSAGEPPHFDDDIPF